MPAAGIVTCTTDFGLDDGYVAQLHGALLSVNPTLQIVDISHAVPPAGPADDLTTMLTPVLFLTETVWPQFPPGTVHIVVVDPGVGGDRGLVAMETPGTEGPPAWLVGPDTGVLSSGLPQSERPAAGTTRVSLPRGYAAVDIRGTSFATGPVSGTFHGRDLMAPVAAALASGRPLSDAGPSIGEITLAAPLATPLTSGALDEAPGGGVVGRILHIDRFGNAITSFRAHDAGPAYTIRVGLHDVGARSVRGPAGSYAAAAAGAPPDGHAVALTSSSGYVEIAVPRGSAASELGIQRGDPASIRRGHSPT